MDNPNKIKIEAWEIELCKIACIPILVYARNKRERELERIEYEKWLQTPAGAVYMAKRRAAYEKKLARDRASAKARRAKRKVEKSSCLPKRTVI